MTEMMYREALRRAIDEEMQRDPLVFLMGETIAERGGSYKVTEGLWQKYGLQRVIDTPIAEASFTGMAVGAALVGCRPVIEILFIDFAMLAMDQILTRQVGEHDSLVLHVGENDLPEALAEAVRSLPGVLEQLRAGASVSARAQQGLCHYPGSNRWMGGITAALRMNTQARPRLSWNGATVRWVSGGFRPPGWLVAGGVKSLTFRPPREGRGWRRSHSGDRRRSTAVARFDGVSVPRTERANHGA